MKIRLFITALISSCASIFGQSAAVYFEIIPEQHLVQIESNRRKDMLDMKKIGQKAEVQNRLGGFSEMTDLTENYLRIRVSDNSTFEMKLFPCGQDEQLIAVIHTTCAPVCDSEISFYTTTWELIPGEKIYKVPGRADFIREDVDRNDSVFQQAYRSIDMDLIRLKFDPQSNAIIATAGYEQMLPDFIYKELKYYLKDTLQTNISPQCWK